MTTSSLQTPSNDPIKATKGTCTGWHDSLLSLLRQEQRSSEGVSGLDMIVVDNAKPHRKSPWNQNSATVTPTSSLDDSLGDFSSFLDDLFENRDEEDNPKMQSLGKWHNSYPAQKQPRKKGGFRNPHGNGLEWGFSSDPEIGHLTLDDMLREECGQSPLINMPRRPVRQVSLDGGPTWEDGLNDTEHKQGNTTNDR